MRINSSNIFVGSAASVVLGLVFLHLPATQPVVRFGSVFLVTSLLYMVMAVMLQRAAVSSRMVLTFIAISILLRLSFVAMNPIGSEDAYRYIWDGKVQANGINPYLYTALDERLRPLHSPLLPAAMNHADLKTIYFPLSEWIFYACYVVGGESLWSFKLVYVLAEVLTMTGLLLVLSRSAIDRKYLLLYALCPLPILEFAVDAHLDAIGLPLLVFALYLYHAERKMLSYILIGLSISIKPVGLIALPAIFVFTKGWKNKLSAVCVPALVMGVQFIPYLVTSNPFETLFDFTKNWSFNGPVFEVFYHWISDNQQARLCCAGLLSVALLALILRPHTLVETIYYSLLFLIIFSPVVHPWYVCWLCVLFPIVRRWSGIALAAGASLTSFTVMHYRLTGVWEQYPIVLVLEYTPVLVLAGFELRRYFQTREVSSLA